MRIEDMPRMSFGEWIMGKTKWYKIREWWDYHLHDQLFDKAHDKLESLNPKVMPDTITVRSWTRLGLSVEFTVRMIDADENMVTGGREPNKSMGNWECDGRRWTYFSRNNEVYIIEPKVRC